MIPGGWTFGGEGCGRALAAAAVTAAGGASIVLGAPIACRLGRVLRHISHTLPSNVFSKVQAWQIQLELGLAADML